MNKGPNLITASQVKALSARMVNAVPTDISRESADWLIKHPKELNEAVSASMHILVTNQKPVEGAEERLAHVLRRIKTALPYISENASTGLFDKKASMVQAAALLCALEFAEMFVQGKRHLSPANFDIDLTPFGYATFGKIRQEPPAAFSDLMLVSAKDFFPEALMTDECDRGDFEDFLSGSAACGQITAEWVMKHASEMPTEWRAQKLDWTSWNLLSFPASGWSHADGLQHSAFVLDLEKSSERFWLDRTAGSDHRQDVRIVCRRQ